MKKLVLTLCLIAAATPAPADVLILKNGEKISGDHKKEGNKHTIVTYNGEVHTYDKSEVKKVKYQSRVTLAEASAKMDMLMNLVYPLFKAPEPEEYQFFRDVFTSNMEYSRQFSEAEIAASQERTFRGENGEVRYSIGARRMEANERGGSSSRSEAFTLRDKDMDETFIDEWGSYTDKFKRLKRNSDYNELKDIKKRSNSLYEFAKHPPVGLEDEAKTVLEALVALKKCIRQAERSLRKVNAISHIRRRGEREIRELRQKMNIAGRKTGWNEEEKRSIERDYQRHASALEKRENRLTTDIASKNKIAKTEIREFVSLRDDTVTKLFAAYDKVQVKLVQGPKQGQPTAKVVSLTGGEQVHLTDAIEKARTFAREYPQKSIGRTSAGCEDLQLEINQKIVECFLGYRLHMTINIHDIQRKDENGIRLLTAGDPAGVKGELGAKVSLEINPQLYKDQFSSCDINDQIEIIATIHMVETVPPLDELKDDESSKPTFTLTGSLAGVEKGCGE